jgi:hypothetical protein
MRKIIIIITIISLLNLIGCYSYQTITKDELSQAEEYKDLQVITKNKYVYEFDEGNYTFSEDSIYGSGNFKLMKGKRVYENYEGGIKFEDIEKLRMEGFDVVTTILAIGIPVVVIIIAAASFSPLGDGQLFSE